MKKRLINLIIDACYRIDNRRGVLEHYDYEEHPYCGYHKSGTKGVLYSSDYHEGDGGECAEILGFRFCKSTEDEYWWNFRYKLTRAMYLNGEFIVRNNYTTFFNELKAIFHHYKHGFRLKYQWKRKG